MGLRSWWRTPYAYYIRGIRDAQRLTKEEYDILSQCDGSVDLPTSPTLERLVQQGFMTPLLRERAAGLHSLAEDGVRQPLLPRHELDDYRQVQL